MSDANIKLAQDAYAAFAKGDIPAILDMLTPDIRFGIVGRKQDAPFFGIHDGKAGAADFFKLLDEAHAIRNEDAATCRAIGEAGASLIHDGDGVLTHSDIGI